MASTSATLTPLQVQLRRLLTSPAAWYRAALLLVGAFFVLSLFTAGPVYDEGYEFAKLKTQLVFAGKVLSGEPGLNFGSMGEDAYFGVGTVLIPYFLSYLIDIVWLKQAYHGYDYSYSVILHILTFLLALAAAAYTRRLVFLVTADRDAGFLAGTMLLLTPFWIGSGFFDYKDIPVATGIIAATYYAAAYSEDRRSRTSLRFFLALFFFGIQRFTLISLALPACVAVLIAALRQPSPRRFAILTAQAMMCMLLLYLATPPAWLQPIELALTSFEASQSYWPGCTLTAGECIGRGASNGLGYSAAKYLAIWYGAKLPILIWAGLVGSVYFYGRSLRDFRPSQQLVVAALVWPILAMSFRNSALYDGVRHTLFLVPLAVATVFVLIPPAFWRSRAWFIAGYLLFLAIDSFQLQPYQYVWFNELARFFASEKNFETDYWGYSLREATAHAIAQRGPNDWIISRADPGFLVGIFAERRFARNLDAVPTGGTYFDIGITRGNTAAPGGCGEVWYVARRELLSPIPLHLAIVAKCGGPAVATVK